MKAEELRIGNWVRIKDEEVKTHAQVEGTGNLQHVAGQLWSIEELEPIPLTEEWLERFNVEWSDWRVTYNKTIDAYEVERKYTSMYGEEWVFMSNVRYIHEFQNIYHALTGEELTIKE